MIKNMHKCKGIELVGGWIDTEDEQCELHISRIATEQDLEENHHLEEVGETIESVVISVSFCPYCGEKLRKNKSDHTLPFRHIDYSKR